MSMEYQNREFRLWRTIKNVSVRVVIDGKRQEMTQVDSIERRSTTIRLEYIGKVIVGAQAGLVCEVRP